MKAIILAAGQGVRLARSIPKSLTRLKNEGTIIDSQIRNLRKYMSVDDIYVVVGYKKELIMESHPELIYIYNDGYKQTNTAKSLLRALKKIETDVIWLNGDVVFDEKILENLLSASGSAVCVQTKKCGNEEMKYSLDDSGFIKEISKNVKNAVGEAVGINMFRMNDLPSFIRNLEGVGDKDYFEKAMENMIRREFVKFIPVDVKNNFCMDIDFPEDLSFLDRNLTISLTADDCGA